VTPEYDWYFDRNTRRYVIRRNGRNWQEITPNRQNPAHGRAYVVRCVAILNGEQ